jgi:hypothetical protein
MYRETRTHAATDTTPMHKSKIAVTMNGNEGASERTVSSSEQVYKCDNSSAMNQIQTFSPLVNFIFKGPAHPFTRGLSASAPRESSSSSTHSSTTRE